ncbi:MAG: hypothetical protein GKS05_08865 [Nitrospirales bacterium]|nr:hypothetical protein [Nitrospirales bacterium]
MLPMTTMYFSASVKKLTLLCIILVGMITGGIVSVLASDPPDDTKQTSVAVRIPLVEGVLPWDDPMSAVWNEAKVSEFNLAPQVHWQDRVQEVTVMSVKVRGLHDGEKVAVLLEYKDPSNDQADAAALEFMVGDKKAHFAHGQEMLQVEGGPVNIWYWKNEAGKGIDMSAKGFKTLRTQDQQDVSAKGIWQDGTWRVVFSRSLQTNDEHDAQIDLGEWSSIAFAFWDGKLEGDVPKEKGSQKSVSSWFPMRAEPPPDNSVYGYVALGLALAVAFELVFVRKLKKGLSA